MAQRSSRRIGTGQDAGDRLQVGGLVSPGIHNVLVVVLDDIGIDKLSFYPVGTDTIFTPVLAGLAAEGITFHQAYANPICGPTRGCLMSGRYPFRTGFGSNVRNPGGFALPDEEVGLGDLASAAHPRAYASAAFNKWHLTRAEGDEEHPVRAAGFGTFVGHMGNLGDDDGSIPDPHHYAWRQITAGPGGFDAALIQGPPFDTTTFATSVSRKALQRWINDQTAPFVAYWCPIAPHAPFQVPPHELLSADTIAGLPRGFSQPLPLPNGSVAPSNQPEKVRQYYHALAEATDTELGRLLDGIAAKLEETVVIVFGDNGTPADVVSAGFDPEHAKSTVYQQGVQVPLIVTGPIVDLPGRTSHELVHAVDVWAAVAELVGTRDSTLPAGFVFDGVSFLDVVADREAGGRRERVFCERFRPAGFDAGGELVDDLLYRCYLDGIYKYMFVRESNGSGTAPVTERFFNIEDDPLELVDLKATGTWTPEEQALYKTLKGEMEDLVAGA